MPTRPNPAAMWARLRALLAVLGTGIRRLRDLIGRTGRTGRRAAARLAGLLGPGDRARQSLLALGLNSLTSLVAGAFLGAITGTLERYPGMLLLVPAAIGLRGNVFTGFGNRLSTAIHTGQFEPTLRRNSLLMQNVLAAMTLTAAMSVVLAVVGRSVAATAGLTRTIPLADLVVVSAVGGLLASVAVLGASVGLALGAVRYGWDLDSVVSPIVSTLGDLLTLPALWVATDVIDLGGRSVVLGSVLAVASLASLVFALRSRHTILRDVTRQSIPVLLVALVLSTQAGIVLEHRLDTFARYPALLVLLPAFVSSAGALGGILASRLGSLLHLGLADPSWIPGTEVRRDLVSLLLLGAPVYLLNGVGAQAVAALTGHAGPGLAVTVGAAMAGGLATTLFVLAVAHLSASATFRLRLDPDSTTVPVITSSVDFVGALALIAAVAVIGLPA